MDKKKLIRYGIYVLFFVILALIVSFCAIWIKYKVMNFEVMNKEPDIREYSTYYNALNYKQQLLYNAITSAADEVLEESEVLTYSYDMDEFQKVLHCVRADRADLFYVDFNQLVLYHSNHKTKVGMIYLADGEDISVMRQEFSEAVDAVMENVLPSMTDFEKEVAINDWLTDNCSYAIGGSSALSSTAYGALVEGGAFCDGYAYAAKHLLNKAYIDALVVYGEADGAEHVWNMVEIEGHYYHLDVMWNDADIGGDNKMRFHGYFNLNDDSIKLDHSYENDGMLPQSMLDNNYYKQQGCYAETADEMEEVLYKQLMSAVESDREYIELLCPETKDNEAIGTPYTAALNRVNEELGYQALYEAFSVYEASAQNNSITIQIFYN